MHICIHNRFVCFFNFKNEQFFKNSLAGMCPDLGFKKSVSSLIK